MTRGRPPKPFGLLVAENATKGKRSNRYLADRAAAQVHLGEEGLKNPPEIVRKDSEALKKWNELFDLYTGFEFISSADTDVVASYCVVFSEVVELQKARLEVKKIAREKGFDAHAVVNKLEASGIDRMLSKKITLLRSLAGDIFLTPLARVKNTTPKKESAPIDVLEQQGFGMI